MNPQNGQNPVKEGNNVGNLDIGLNRGPKIPSLASKDARLRSFVNWPESANLRPAELSEAGFYYVGVQDYTRCFYCDGRLRGWEKDDDPWMEHARWYPDCEYVKANKGDDFVKACQTNPTQISIAETSVPSTSKAIEPLQVSQLSSNVQQQVDEFMNSDVVKSVTQTGVFSEHVIRKVLLRRVENNEGNFRNADELFETLLNLQSKTEVIEGQLSATHFEQQLDDEEMNIVVKHSSNLSKPTQAILGQNVKESSTEYDLKDQRLCKICMDKEIGILFIPCGHLMTCVQCASALSDCPICRRPIRGAVRAFLP